LFNKSPGRGRTGDLKVTRLKKSYNFILLWAPRPADFYPSIRQVLCHLASAPV
jgi:hypothetical protein